MVRRHYLGMREDRIPGARFQTICPKCSNYVIFFLFQSSFYDFDTYFGTRSQRYYRLDLSYCGYAGIDSLDALLPGRENEAPNGELIHLPDQVWCVHCEYVMVGPDLSGLPYSEEQVDAYLLPFGAKTA